VAGTHVNARASADAALCGAASILMSLLQQIPEKYHDHNDVHITAFLAVHVGNTPPGRKVNL
jgi:hypothetical protein